MTLHLYNTLTKQKGPFKPIRDNQVSIYLCGPTVYDLLHIGNFRGAIFFNLLRNWLEKKGMKVEFAYNYTDVDDKIINKAIEEGVDSRVVSERYIQEFEKDFNRLGLRPHTYNPKVTDFMPQIISFVAGLLEKGVAYEIEGEVFYAIDSFSEYGKLSGKKLEDLVAGQRVDVDSRKRNPGDFVLWKPSKENEPAWDSPWGKGRPGWHIECSAMIRSLLGETIDIHGGGIDLIFPHHENEIAQGEGLSGQTYCNHWVHNEFINLKGEKMSKSLGNVITGRAFMDRYHPEILKYLYLSVHYRSVIGIDEERVEQVMAELNRIYLALATAEYALNNSEGKGEADPKFTEEFSKWDEEIKAALDDDFNTKEVMARIFEGVRRFNNLNILKNLSKDSTVANAAYFLTWVRQWGELMALFSLPPAEFLETLSDIHLKEKKIERNQVEEAIQKRQAARVAKDWALADQVRDQLKEWGISAVDGNPLRSWEIIKNF